MPQIFFLLVCQYNNSLCWYFIYLDYSIHGGFHWILVDSLSFTFSRTEIFKNFSELLVPELLCHDLYCLWFTHLFISCLKSLIIFQVILNYTLYFWHFIYFGIFGICWRVATFWRAYVASYCPYISYSLVGICVFGRDGFSTLLWESSEQAVSFSGLSPQQHSAKHQLLYQPQG